MNAEIYTVIPDFFSEILDTSKWIAPFCELRSETIFNLLVLYTALVRQMLRAYTPSGHEREVEIDWLWKTLILSIAKGNQKTAIDQAATELQDLLDQTVQSIGKGRPR